ncbi:hypothetical protein [Litoribacter populi]|uniref:hypothetical protein n=1 Tax=Litoribacter populi TaxID=2598460 RepID=UPI0011804C22|nr:hypothetical protein [Litoribacter populi]
MNRYLRYTNRKNEPSNPYKEAGFSDKEDFSKFCTRCEYNFLDAISSHPNRTFMLACFNIVILQHTYNAVKPEVGPLFSLVEYHSVVYFLKFDENKSFSVNRLDSHLTFESPKVQTFLQYSYANKLAIQLDNSMLKGDYDTFEDVFEALLIKK